MADQEPEQQPEAGEDASLTNNDESLATKIAKEEAAKTTRLMQLTSKLLFVLSIVLAVSVFVVSSLDWRFSWAAFFTTLILAGFAFAMGYSIAKVYGAGKGMPFHWNLKGKLPQGEKFYQLICVKFKIRKDQDLITAIPKYYMIVSALLLVAGSVVMIIGDTSIAGSGFRKILRPYSIGFHYIHASLGSGFLVAATLNLILCLKANKTLLTSAIFINIFCIISAFVLMCLNMDAVRYMSSLVTRDSLDSTERKNLIALITDDEGSIKYPLTPLTCYATMKLAPPAILLALSLGNLWSHVGTFFELQASTDKTYTKTNIVIGAVGSLLMVLAVAITVATTSLYKTGGQEGYMYSTISFFQCIIITTMTLLSVMGMLCLRKTMTSNFHKNLMFVLCGVVLIGSGCFAYYTVSEFNGRAHDRMESRYFSDESMCKQANDTSMFCVRNITRNSERSRNNYGRYVYDGETLACIPKTKICDGIADLVFPDMDGKFNFMSCGSDSYYDAHLFVDEVYCTQPETVNGVLGLLSVTMILAALMAALTFNSVVATLGKVGRGLLSWLETSGEFTSTGQRPLVEEEDSRQTALSA